MRVLVALAALVLFASPAAAGPRQDYAVKQFGRCVRDAAARLEPSGEAPGAVATAAVSACGDAEVRMTDALADAHLLGPLVKAGPAIALDETETVERAAHQQAEEKVVEIRACQKTPGCIPS